MKEFKNLGLVLKEIWNNRKDIIGDVLINDVAPAVEKILLSHIKKDIYGAYSPTKYHRRGSLKKSIESEVYDGTTLYTTATSEPNAPAKGWVSAGKGAFLYMLEHGDLGFWRKGFPRPAISLAQKEIESSSSVRRAIERGFKRLSDE